MNNAAYISFDRQQWQQLRKETPMPLIEADLDQLHGEIETVSLQEIRDIYLPLTRLLSYYVTARQALHGATSEFLSRPVPKVPYVIGVAGSVAVGKSTTSRVLQALLSQWSDHPRVALVPTDGFIFPNATLEAQNLMSRKGFPESYDLPRLLQFLADLKSGKTELQVPIYSHHNYDILPNESQLVDQPDIVILEGLNILQTGGAEVAASQQQFVSDYLDFSIFVDANPGVIEQWYIERFQSFRTKAFKDPTAYFHRFSQLNSEEAVKMAMRYWHEINLLNLEQNILPFKQRARLILSKGKDHSVRDVYLRKI
ncbi:MAG: type I pantothenate kinase [Coxiellaceae bacterium]|nr:type I pantothenate kinase [Coxiellaceae bacterium]